MMLLCEVPIYPSTMCVVIFFFFFQAEDGIRDLTVTGVQTCALPISVIHCRAPFFKSRQLDRSRAPETPVGRGKRLASGFQRGAVRTGEHRPSRIEIGRASCRERV